MQTKKLTKAQHERIKKYFSLYGTKSHVSNITGVARSTINRVIELGLGSEDTIQILLLNVPHKQTTFN